MSDESKASAGVLVERLQEMVSPDGRLQISTAGGIDKMGARELETIKLAIQALSATATPASDGVTFYDAVKRYSYPSGVEVVVRIHETGWDVYDPAKWPASGIADFRAIVEVVAEADSNDTISSLDVDIPCNGYPRQWLGNAARNLLAATTATPDHFGEGYRAGVDSFIAAIHGRTPNGEWIAIKHHPNGDWSVADAPSGIHPDMIRAKAIEVAAGFVSADYPDERDIQIAEAAIRALQPGAGEGA